MVRGNLQGNQSSVDSYPRPRLQNIVHPSRHMQSLSTKLKGLIQLLCSPTLTYSARGSCSLRAMDTAPLRDTSIVGNSCALISDVLYALAPHSLTVHQPISFLSFVAFAVRKSDRNASVSFEAVPFPIAAASTLCLLIMYNSLFADSSLLKIGELG